MSEFLEEVTWFYLATQMVPKRLQNEACHKHKRTDRQVTCWHQELVKPWLCL